MSRAIPLMLLLLCAAAIADPTARLHYRQVLLEARRLEAIPLARPTDMEALRQVQQRIDRLYRTVRGNSAAAVSLRSTLRYESLWIGALQAGNTSSGYYSQYTTARDATVRLLK